MVAIGSLLIAGQIIVQRQLDAQEGDARLVNLAGRQRMLSQRLCMLMLELLVDSRRASVAELRRVADEWQGAQAALRQGREGGNSAAAAALFDQISDDHDAMLAAAHGALADGDPTVAARAAFAHQDAFLDGMDRIVAVYEREAEERVVRLRQAELVLLLIALVVLALEGAFVFRPAARALRDHLAQRDRAEAQLLQVSDREQKRLARDLHDGLGQHLVGVSYLLKALRQEGGMAAQRDRFDEINRLLTDAIEQTRSMARALHSHTLEMEGLVAALQGLALQTERVYGIACRVELAGEIERPRAGLELYGIAREAIANAARHAHATAIDIVLTVRDDQVTLVVCDDGIGIGTSPDGLGLHLMRHRARLIGAALEVSGGPSRGTVVTCVLNEAGA